MVTSVTSISLAAICTNGEVKGGKYISRFSERCITPTTIGVRLERFTYSNLTKTARLKHAEIPGWCDKSTANVWQ